MSSQVRPSWIWHYTTGEKIGLILKEGMIRQSPNVGGSERPAVWFSSNPVWEVTSRKGRFDPISGGIKQLEMEEHLIYCGGLFRIAIAADTAPHDWHDFRQMSGILPRDANLLRSVAIKWGGRPGEWFVSFDPVYQSDWLGVESWRDGQWTPMQVSQSRRMAA